MSEKEYIRKNPVGTIKNEKSNQISGFTCMPFTMKEVTGPNLSGMRVDGIFFRQRSLSRRIFCWTAFPLL